MFISPRPPRSAWPVSEFHDPPAKVTLHQYAYSSAWNTACFTVVPHPRLVPLQSFAPLVRNFLSWLFLRISGHTFPSGALRSLGTCKQTVSSLGFYSGEVGSLETPPVRFPVIDGPFPSPPVSRSDHLIGASFTPGKLGSKMRPSPALRLGTGSLPR